MDLNLVTILLYEIGGRYGHSKGMCLPPFDPVIIKGCTTWKAMHSSEQNLVI